MAVLTLLASGCSSPVDPVDSPLTGNAHSDDESDQSQVSTGVNPGDLAPNFILNDSYGDEISLSELHGKPVLLFFWTTSCPYCEDQYPRIQGFYDDYNDSLAVFSVNLGASAQLINAYLADRDLTFPCLMADGDFQSAYAVSAVPHALLMDADGMVSFNGHPAYLSDQLLQNQF